MSTLRVDNIRHNSATSDAITMASDGTCTAKVTNPLTNRRLNYNGAMLINQRGDVSNTTQFFKYYGPDRYYHQGESSNNGSWNIGQSTDVPDGYGFKYSLDYSCTATSSNANRYLMTVYRMEGVDCQLLNYGTANAKTVTLSFWIKCSKAGNFQVNFENEQNPDAGYQTQQTINSAGQWEKKVVTIPGDTTKALTFGTQKAFCFDIMYSAYGNYAADTPTAAWSSLSNGQRGTHCNMDLFDSTSNYVRITGVQLELGDHATDFEHLPYLVELERCKRYYQTLPSGLISVRMAQDTSYSNAGLQSTHFLPTPMRAMPSLLNYSDGTSQITHTFYDGNYSNAISRECNMFGASHNGAVQFHFNYSAALNSNNSLSASYKFGISQDVIAFEADI
jgi:hypothetical protein